MSAERDPAKPSPREPIKLFLCGDVMTGRGIDQILPHPCDPRLHEHYMDSAIDYVRLAEETVGLIPRPVDPAYVWGAALEELVRVRPDARIINLETSITRSDAWVDKGINYRMSPENGVCLRAAGIDCCVLANNHVLDWGPAGLRDTLATLETLGIKTAGAGRDLAEASKPAVLDIAGKGRVIVLAFGVPTSGVPRGWAATERAPGLNILPDFSEESVALVRRRLEGTSAAGRCRRPVASLGAELGIRHSAISSTLRTQAHRRGGCLSRPWPFVASRQGDRGLPPAPDPLWLRRLSERLRRHRRQTGIPRRPRPHVFRQRGSNARRPRRIVFDAAADSTFPARPRDG